MTFMALLIVLLLILVSLDLLFDPLKIDSLTFFVPLFWQPLALAYLWEGEFVIYLQNCLDIIHTREGCFMFVLVAVWCLEPRTAALVVVVVVVVALLLQHLDLPVWPMESQRFSSPGKGPLSCCY